jgi:hypothetical protein
MPRRTTLIICMQITGPVFTHSAVSDGAPGRRVSRVCMLYSPRIQSYTLRVMVQTQLVAYYLISLPDRF